MIIMKKNKFTVVGIGYVGLPLAVSLSKFAKVIGFDVNKKRIQNLREHIDDTNEFKSNYLKKVKDLNYSFKTTEIKDSDIFFITVPTPINKKKKPDLKNLIDATKIVSRNLKKGSIIVYESTVFPGCTEEICLPLIEKISNLKYNKSIFNLIKIAISKSQFLKVSKEEALLFFNSFDPEEISKGFKNNLDVVITNGGKDIFWYLSNLKGKTKLSFSNNILDTTGAGDAFLSGMICQLLNKKKNYNYEEVSKMIKFSSVCGYLTCLKPGAISSQPTLEEVVLFLKEGF